MQGCHLFSCSHDDLLTETPCLRSAGSVLQLLVNLPEIRDRLLAFSQEHETCEDSLCFPRDLSRHIIEAAEHARAGATLSARWVLRYQEVSPWLPFCRSCDSVGEQDRSRRLCCQNRRRSTLLVRCSSSRTLPTSSTLCSTTVTTARRTSCHGC